MQRRTEQSQYTKQSDYFGLDESDINELKGAFGLLDTDKDGKLNPEELLDILRDGEYFKKNPLMVEIFQELANKHIKDPEDPITVEVFLSSVFAKLGEKSNKAEAEKVFQLFDKDGTKKITLEALKAIVEETKQDISNEELQDILYRASQDGNGNQIVQEEFVKAIMKNSY